MMNEIVEFEIRDGGLGTSKPRMVLGKVSRVAQQRSGYEVVRFNKKLYVLRGGIRTDYFISLDLPVKGRIA